jgi:ribosomal protein S18 acetylase RimI-like enzyme
VIQIRLANKADEHAISVLHTQSWRLTYEGLFTNHYMKHELPHERAEYWKKFFKQPAPENRLVVAVDSAKVENILGFACAFGKYDAEFGTVVENLHVHPEHQSVGLGRLLLSDIASWSLARFPEDYLHLWVAAQNRAAIGFYQRLGGIISQQSAWITPDGQEVPTMQFVWKVPARLIEK